MQESQLVLGIDLCDDITQVTAMRPNAAEPDAVSFDAETRREFLPTVLVQKGEQWELEEKADKQESSVSFFHAAMLGKEVQYGGKTISGELLLREFLKRLFKKITDRFYGQQIGFVAITCEEAEVESRREFLSKVIAELGLEEKKFKVMSHLDAFLHYAVRQEESLWKNGSAAFDYTTEGVRFYSMECRILGGRLLLSDVKDYSDVMPSDFLEKETAERAALTFERLAGRALMHKPTSLFITGRGFEGEWTADVLRLLSGGRRVFRGQNLYTQGACYTAAQIFYDKGSSQFSVYGPTQITYQVYLQAESANEEEILMAEAGTEYSKVQSEVTVILDSVDKIAFRVTPVGINKDYYLRVSPSALELRSDRTSRYEIRVFFAGKDKMVIQIKDTGFGDFYPSKHRIYEEILDLSQLEV